MESINERINQLYNFEEMARQDTLLTRLHPAGKIGITMLYLVCIMSCNRLAIGRILPFIFVPVIWMALSEVPFHLVWKRAMIALPFCLFGGISNLIFEQEIVLVVGSISVTVGMISFLVILLRTYLCVVMVLSLVATTPFMQITMQLRRMHIPDIFVTVLEMMYRYIGLLGQEAHQMTVAYRLRNGGEKGIAMKHMGSFIGQLLIRSIDRATTVYQAMRLRGYGGKYLRQEKRRVTKADGIFIVIFVSLIVILRSVDLQNVMTNLVLYIMK